MPARLRDVKMATLLRLSDVIKKLPEGKVARLVELLESDLEGWETVGEYIIGVNVSGTAISANGYVILEKRGPWTLLVIEEKEQDETTIVGDLHDGSAEDA